jgi:hypothetical protein
MSTDTTPDPNLKAPRRRKSDQDDSERKAAALQGWILFAFSIFVAGVGLHAEKDIFVAGGGFGAFYAGNKIPRSMLKNLIPWWRDR